MCVSYWDNEEDLPQDYVKAKSGLEYIDPYDLENISYHVRKGRGVQLGKNVHRACQKKLNNILTYEYLMLGRGHHNKTYVRLERERTIENRNAEMSNVILGVMVGFYVLSFIAFMTYLELIVLRRLKLLREAVARLSAMDNSDDEFYGDGDPFADDDDDDDDVNNDVNKSKGDVGKKGNAKERKTDEIGSLRFLAKMQVESLRKRYDEVINHLRVEKTTNDHIFDVVSLMSMTKERKDKHFIRARLPKSPCASNTTLHHVFTCPVTLEFFKDYCAGEGKLSYIFFFLDVMWLRTLEAVAASGKKHPASPAVVATAKMIGQKYILRKGSSHIELKKEIRQKICALESYTQGMYDEAYEEVVGKLEVLLEGFMKSHQYKEATTILSIKAGDPMDP